MTLRPYLIGSQATPIPVSWLISAQAGSRIVPLEILPAPPCRRAGAEALAQVGEVPVLVDPVAPGV